MIGAPTLDPKGGDRRQKALAAAVAARLRSMSRMAKTGVGRGARTGMGVRVAGGGGRPGGILDFLSGKGMGAFGPGGVNYEGVGGRIGSLPGEALGPPGRLPGPLGGDGIDPGYTQPLGGGGIDPGYTQPLGDGVDTGYTQPLGNLLPPAGPSNYIPLGGGVFYDPTTGSIKGAGLGGTALS